MIHDDVDMWFQKDGETCHTARKTIHWLHATFPFPVLPRFGDQN